MAGVYLGHDQGNIFLHPEGAGIANHGATSGSKLRLEIASDARVQRGEDDPRSPFRRRIRHRHSQHALGDRCLQAPTHSFPIGLSGRTIRSRQPRNFEPGMGFQQLYKTLADNTGGAKDSDGDFLLGHDGERQSYITFTGRRWLAANARTSAQTREEVQIQGNFLRQFFDLLIGCVHSEIGRAVVR